MKTKKKPNRITSRQPKNGRAWEIETDLSPVAANTLSIEGIKDFAEEYLSHLLNDAEFKPGDEHWTFFFYAANFYLAWAAWLVRNDVEPPTMRMKLRIFEIEEVLAGHMPKEFKLHLVEALRTQFPHWPSSLNCNEKAARGDE